MTTDRAAAGPSWKVWCESCQVTVAEGDGLPPTHLEVSGHMETGTVNTAIHRHLTEAGGQVHKLNVITRGRITEKR